MASDGETTCTNDPNFAVIYSFLKVFGKLYGLEIPSITKLQESIEDTQEVLEPLKELHVRLLRRAQKSVQPNRWERCLIKFCHQQGFHQEAWEMERFSYKKASTTVKLKVLKILLEYQFTCHGKFKNAVNAISCKDLRLDPVGKDKNGCVYWLQVDEDANLNLYKEDQDEETWQLVARNREELVKVISQLKKGEDIGASIPENLNEDSNSTDVPLESKENKSEEDNNEEFLSPESETDNESEDVKESDSKKTEPPNEIEQSKDDKIDQESCKTEQTDIVEENNLKKHEEKESEDPNHTNEVVDESNTINDEENTKDSSHNPEPSEAKMLEKDQDCKSEKKEVGTENDEKDVVNSNDVFKEPEINDKKELEVSEAVEEPVMLITGDGNGADCDSSYIIGEEIYEPVMFFWGEGSGYDNDTGNPEVTEQSNSAEDSTERESRSAERTNGECNSSDVSSASSKTPILGSTIKLRSSQISSAKRSLKKQPNDSVEALKSDPKKHCVRNLEKSDSSSSVNNDKSTKNSESLDSKQNKRKTKAKVKKNSSAPPRKIKLKEEKSNSISETDHCENKSAIIEKRKSSISSTEHEDNDCSDKEEKDAAQSDKETKLDDTLPLKKAKLEVTPEPEELPIKSEEDASKSDSKTNNDKKNNGDAKTSPILKRKKIKAHRGKFKRKKPIKQEVNNVTSELKKEENNEEQDPLSLETKVETKYEEQSTKKGKSKSLKRSLLDATQSDKNKTESQSESEDEEPATRGKRLKIKPKKINSNSRKKVEAKIQEKNTSEESEEETLYSLAGKKTPKKPLKKKPKKPNKCKPLDKTAASDDDQTPVRQSRRIAQLKIREEAERRHQEEVALRELKIQHKKVAGPAGEEEEEEWRASGASSASECEVKKRRGGPGGAWRASESTPPPSDSDTDEPLFEHVHEEPDLEYSKSDHEFSPESDLETGEPCEPLKRARTLQEGRDAGGVCMRCGSGEQPEWILLCDACDDGYHAACLKPLLFLVPEGDWFCPPCQHKMLIESLESELTKYDELLKVVEEERAKKKLTEPDKKGTDDEKAEKGDKSDSSSSSGSSSCSSEDSGAVYRLRERRQLPVSYRSQEYDRLISSAIKEEYVEPTSSAGNQGRGKDISTIIEAAEEEKMKAEREAIEQGKPVEKKCKKKQRRKPRKLNSLEVPSEDDDDIDEDFKDTGMESTSEEISSDAEKDSSSDSRSSDSLPIRRACRGDSKKERSKMVESPPEMKKKKGVFQETSSESSDAKDWAKKSKKSKSKPKKKRDKSSSKPKKKRRGLTQYDAEGNVIRARVTYGGLSGGEGENDWSPKHRTRQKKINYTEMPNTESEDEMHKSSGKHMPDSSDEFKVDDSDLTSDSDREKNKKKAEEGESEEKKRAISDLVSKTAVVPLEKLPDDVTKQKQEELTAHLNAQSAAGGGARTGRGRGSRSGRGGRGPRGRGRGGGGGSGGRPPTGEPSDEALAKLVGVKIKDLGASPEKPNSAEKEKKRLEREAKIAEKEAKRLERIQKKEEKEKLKEQKAKEREEKRVARLAMQENKRIKKEKPEFHMNVPIAGYHGMAGPRPLGPDMQRMPNMFHPQGSMQPRHPAHPAGGEQYPPEQRFTGGPRLQVRPELRAMQPDLANVRAPPPLGDRHAMREGTLSVAGSPQPFKPITEEPSIITRMPHMINQQYRGPMYQPGNPLYGYPRGPPQNMPMGYPMHPHLNQHAGARQAYGGPQGPYQPYSGHGPPGYPSGSPQPRHGPPHMQGQSGQRPAIQGPPGLSPEARQHLGLSQDSRQHPVMAQDGRSHPGMPPDGRQHPGMTSEGRQHPGMPPEGRQHPGMPSEGRQHPGMPPEGRQHPGMPPEGRQHPGMPQEGRQHPGMPPEGRQHPGMPPEGRQHPGMPSEGRQHPGMPPEGRQHPGMPPEGRQHPGMPPEGRQHPGMPPEGRQHPGMPPEGRQHPGMPPEGRQHPGMPSEGRQHPGMPSEGRQHPGMPPESRQHPGMPPESRQHPGMPPEGRQHPGMPPEGRQHPGMSAEGRLHPGILPDGRPHHGMPLEGRLHPGMPPEGRPHPGMTQDGRSHPLPLDGRLHVALQEGRHHPGLPLEARPHPGLPPRHTPPGGSPHGHPPGTIPPGRLSVGPPGSMPPGTGPPHPSLHGQPSMADGRPLSMTPGRPQDAASPGRPHIPSGRPPGVPTPGANDPSGQTTPGMTPTNLSQGAPPVYTAPGIDPNIKIKAEVKTEPEFSRDSSSPSSPSKDDLPRPHPKIKVTDSKDRKPRYPLGPYAPQYGPYGPYAPPATSTQPSDPHQSALLNLQSRALHPEAHIAPSPLTHRLPPTGLHQFHPSLVQNLNAKPGHVEQSRSPLQRPPSAHMERPTHPSLPHEVQGPMHAHSSPYPGGLPPHYMGHLRPPIRPHYGMPMMRHPGAPDRSSPSQINPRLHPPHYSHPAMTQHQPLDHRMSAERPRAASTEAPEPTSQSLPRESVLSPDASPPRVSTITRLETETMKPVEEQDKPDTPPENLQKPAEMPVEEESGSRSPPTAEPEEPKPVAAARLAYINSEDDKSQDEMDKELDEKPAEAAARGEPLPREEGSVFGGLVSYFSSQHEDDDIDA